MVVFCCSVCCDSLKKSQVQTHYSRCRMNMVSCMDCNKEFWNDDYQEHIKCISEEEKYSGKDYKPRPGQNKGEAKQDAWLQQVDQAIKSSSASPRLRSLLERMKDYPNIPRKQAKFLNFIKNSLRIADPKLGMALWDVLMSALPPKKENKEESNGKENVDNNSDKTEEKVEEEEEKEEETKVAKTKMSKREKKEKRKEQNKTEKKEKKKRKHNSDDDDDDADENVDNNNDDDDDEVDKKKKKREENRLSKKKEKKRKREEECTNNVQEQNGTKKKKSHKKQKDDDDDDDGLPPLEANPNHVEEEEEDDDGDDDRPQKKKQNKHFNWERIILTLLRNSKEKSMSEKKLRKKVLAEYMSEGDGHETDSNVLKAKFDRKIKKNPLFVLHKDQIRLKD